MAYLAKDDYTLHISVRDLDEILAEAQENSGLSTATILGNAESWAQAMIKSYLVSRYNIAGEFSKTSVDSSRNRLIIGVYIDLVCCAIHKAINPRDIPELRAKACDAAIQWLKDARDGVIVVDIPAAPSGDTTVPQRTYINSQEKFISKPFSDRSILDGDDII
jgi:hypothetical protein